MLVVIIYVAPIVCLIHIRNHQHSSQSGERIIVMQREALTHNQPKRWWQLAPKGVGTVERGGGGVDMQISRLNYICIELYGHLSALCTAICFAITSRLKPKIAAAHRMQCVPNGQTGDHQAYYWHTTQQKNCSFCLLCERVNTGQCASTEHSPEYDDTNNV